MDAAKDSCIQVAALDCGFIASGFMRGHAPRQLLIEYLQNRDKFAILRFQTEHIALAMSLLGWCQRPYGVSTAVRVANRGPVLQGDGDYAG
jgi:hypothetical protein